MKKETAYSFIHSWIIPLLHAALWLLAYSGTKQFLTGYEDKIWAPVVDVSILCMIFFIEFAITSMDIFFLYPNKNASMSLVVPFGIIVLLFAIIFAAVILYLANISAESATKFLLAIIIISATAKYMEIWLQNNISKFTINIVPAQGNKYALHYRM